MINNSLAQDFGASLGCEFSRAANRGSFRETRLFSALRKAILATAPRFLVEEFHGTRSQVIFPTCPPWTKNVAQCELADLCIVWFCRRPQLSARITFLQAKRSDVAPCLCTDGVGSINQRFYGDSTQWFLLHRRPTLVGRFQRFQPPSNLLKDALLPSVATFCVFHRTAPREYGFFYASADVVLASKPSRPGRVQLTASAPARTVKTGYFDEQKWACCPLTFGQALFAGRIGTPIDHQSVASPDDNALRSSIRRWLASVLAGAVQQQRVGPVVQAFIGMFEIPVLEEPTSAPCRSLIFIQGDEG